MAEQLIAKATGDSLRCFPCLLSVPRRSEKLPKLRLDASHFTHRIKDRLSWFQVRASPIILSADSSTQFLSYMATSHAALTRVKNAFSVAFGFTSRSKKL